MTRRKPSAVSPGHSSGSEEATRRRRLSPEERSAQILDAAAQLLMQEGFSEVSMERLGRDVGISKALVYNYFPSRTDLLAALLTRESALLREGQTRAAAQASDFTDLVRRTTRLYIEHMQQRGTLLRKLWAEPAVARAVAEDHQRSRERAMRYMAREVTRVYGLPQQVALTAVDMQMAMTEEAAQRLAISHESVDFATEICVTLLFGGLEALAKAHGKEAKAIKLAKAAKPDKPAGSPSAPRGSSRQARS